MAVEEAEEAVRGLKKTSRLQSLHLLLRAILRPHFLKLSMKKENKSKTRTFNSKYRKHITEPSNEAKLQAETVIGNVISWKGKSQSSITRPK